MPRTGTSKEPATVTTKETWAGSPHSKLSHLQRRILIVLWDDLEDLDEGMTMKMFRRSFFPGCMRWGRHSRSRALGRLIDRDLVRRLPNRNITLTPLGDNVAGKIMNRLKRKKFRNG